MFKLDKNLEKDTFQLGRSRHNTFLLMNDSNYPWVILVPEQNNITELFQLEWRYQNGLTIESNILAKYLLEKFNGEKMNVANLGNKVSQLHLHHIVRSKQDKAWPDPVWGKFPTQPYKESTNKEPKIAVQIRQDLHSLIKDFTY